MCLQNKQSFSTYKHVLAIRTLCCIHIFKLSRKRLFIRINYTLHVINVEIKSIIVLITDFYSSPDIDFLNGEH